MTTSIRFRYLLFILTGLFFLTLSCRREVEVPLPSPTIDGTPSAASLGGTVTGTTGGDKIEFRVDLYVVDRSGKAVSGLIPNNFTITATQPSSFTYTLSKLETVGQTAKAGGYSAMLLMDQSGSIAYQQGSEPPTDPNDLRITAGKIFLDYLGSSDQVALASFTDSYSSRVILHQGFSRNVSAMKKTLDSLSTTEGGGTPLYYSSVVATDYTAQYAPTSNKAVIVFTDGQNSTNATTTLSQAVAGAKSKGIPLFTVGLSNGVNTQVLSQMSNETGGAFFFAKDAKQLITTFGTLGNLLRGQAQLYRTTWVAARRTSRWTTGNVIAETINVAIPTGDVIDVPFYVRVP